MEENAGGLQKQTWDPCQVSIITASDKFAISFSQIPSPIPTCCKWQTQNEITQKKIQMAWSCLKDGRCKFYKNSPKMDATRETAGRKSQNNLAPDCWSLKMTWGEAENKVKNRAEWKDLVSTLCSTWSEEDK